MPPLFMETSGKAISPLKNSLETLASMFIANGMGFYTDEIAIRVMKTLKGESTMKNRMDVPQEYEPVLPGKVEAHLAKKKAQETDQNSLLAQTAIAVGRVIADGACESQFAR